MKSITKGNIKTAVNSVRRNKTRSIMTMVGIIIGVAPVIIIVSIGEGVKHQVGLQTNHLGKDLITIRPGQSSRVTNPLYNLGLSKNLDSGGSLSATDVTTIDKTAGVNQTVPLAIVGGGAKSNENNKQYNTQVIGTTMDLPIVLNQSLDYGGFFNDSTDVTADKVVIGSHVAEEMFNENVPLGQTMTILGQVFVVSGIFSDFQSTPLSIDADFNNAVFIPLSTAQQLTKNTASIYEILARPNSPEDTDEVVSRIKGNMLASHGGQYDFTVLKQAQTIEITNSIINLLTKLVAGVAIISLFVGGVGIMNIMLVSVTERMHEVGIRKAVGATNRQILNQFVIEALVLSVSGALIGVVLAFFVDICLFLYTDLTPVITWQIVIITFVISVGVGTLFGSVPALKAARKDPINALRND